MARKTDQLTPRQRQSQQLMRQKAAKKKRRALLQKFTVIGGGILSVTLLATTLWLWKSGAAARTAEAWVDGAYGLTARAGFSVQALYLEGRNRTSMDDIDTALGIRKGDPILRFSLTEARARLEKIESVKFAAVERALPGTLYVRIVEREPVALWQREGKTALVDDNGVVMNGLDIAPYQHLPLIVGDDASQHVRELLAILATQPELARRFSAGVYVGERRWNIRLSGEKGFIEIRLPETDPASAWKKLAELQARQQLLDRDVKVIDLRLEGRMFIKVVPEEVPDRNANAKET